MVEIPLSGKYSNSSFLIDAADWELCKQWSWCGQMRVRKHSSKLMVKRGTNVNGMSCTILIHRFILGITDTKVQVDHLDGNTLNNTRSNLRVCDNTLNQWNAGKRPDCSSMFKGVSWETKTQRWAVNATFDGKRRKIGRFIDEEEAACAYDEAIKYRGEYAVFNFPHLQS